MSESLRHWAQLVAASAPHDWAVYALRNVPGLPPIAQTIHIVSVAVLVASIVFIHLRVLGLAYPSQQPQEMLKRLMPWTWWSLPVLLISGLPFILARPNRYFLNPVFGIKVAAIVAVLIITFMFVRSVNTSSQGETLQLKIKLMSFVSLLLWLLIMFAGRWIAYVEYLFPPA